MKKSYKKIIGLALCIIMCIGLLTACGSSELGEYENDPHALQSMLHNSGYQVVIEDGSYYNGEYVNGEYGPTFFNIETVVACTSYSYEEAALFFYCESEVDAKDNADNFSEYFATNSDLYSINPIIKTSGKVVYVGTEGIWEHVISQAEGSSGISIAADLNISVVAIIVIIAVALLLIGGAILVGGIILIIIVIIIIFVIKKKKKAKLAKLNSTQNSKTE